MFHFPPYSGLPHYVLQVYGEIRLPQFPSLNPLITEYAQGTDPKSTTSVGAHFQRPGRTILERLLVDVPSPNKVLGKDNQLGDFTRTYFAGEFIFIYVSPEG